MESLFLNFQSLQKKKELLFCVNLIKILMDSGEAHVEEIAEKLKLDFYKLHYPTRKSPQTKNKTNKLRSNSVISIARDEVDGEQTASYITPKGSARKAIAERKNLPPVKSQDNGNLKNREKSSFQGILSAKSNITRVDDKLLPINNMKEVEELSKNNLNVRLAIQRNKDEKIKMNRIIMSHKQSQQIKIEYLRNKKEEIQASIAMDMRAIYEEFFRKQYEGVHGQNAEQLFEEKFDYLLLELSKRVFQQ